LEHRWPVRKVGPGARGLASKWIRKHEENRSKRQAADSELAEGKGMLT